jgi:hypothetical protein
MFSAINLRKMVQKAEYSEAEQRLVGLCPQQKYSSLNRSSSRMDAEIVTQPLTEAHAWENINCR